MLGQAIGDLLAFALGVAISPIPIIAIILMLLSARAGANSTAFLAGWVAGVAGASVVLLALSGLIGTTSNGAPSTTASVVKLVLGVLLVGLSVRNFRKRPGANEEAELPKWLQSIESITPAKAVGLGVLLSAVNPKNLLMIAGAMVSLSQYHLSVGEDSIAVVVFVLIAISTVAAPVIVYRTAGEKAQRILAAMRGWLGQNNAAVMAVLLLVIGVVLLGKGISGLSA
jgi:threonine/homoserine/homoserine lactone efflux protein